MGHHPGIRIAGRSTHVTARRRALWHPAGSTTATGTGAAVTRRYTHGFVRISQTQLIAGNWTTHHYGYDGGLHVRQLTNAAGAVADSYTCDVFGNLTASTGSTPNLFLYRGEQYHASLLMYYLRARWYRPQVGRFLTRDTYEGEEDDTRSLHGYAYAGGNPQTYSIRAGISIWVRTACCSVLQRYSSHLRLQYARALRELESLQRARTSPPAAAPAPQPNEPIAPAATSPSQPQPVTNSPVAPSPESSSNAPAPPAAPPGFPAVPAPAAGESEVRH